MNLIWSHSLIFIGFVLIWIVRPYFVSISLIFISVIFTTINFYFIFYVFKKIKFLLFLCILFLQIISVTTGNLLSELIKKDFDENAILGTIPTPVLNDNLIDLGSQDYSTQKKLKNIPSVQSSNEPSVDDPEDMSPPKLF